MPTAPDHQIVHWMNLANSCSLHNCSLHHYLTASIFCELALHTFQKQAHRDMQQRMKCPSPLFYE